MPSPMFAASRAFISVKKGRRSWLAKRTDEVPSSLSRKLNRFLETPSIDPIVMDLAGLVADAHTIDGTSFSSREVKRLVGTALGWSTAGNMA